MHPSVTCPRPEAGSMCPAQRSAGRVGPASQGARAQGEGQATAADSSGYSRGELGVPSSGPWPPRD